MVRRIEYGEVGGPGVTRDLCGSYEEGVRSYEKRGPGHRKRSKISSEKDKFSAYFLQQGPI